MGDYSWVHRVDDVDFNELAHLYRVAPLGNKSPEALATVFGNSMFACFVYSDGALVGAGRPLADGVDCAYIGDVAVHPDHQGRGLGSVALSVGKIEAGLTGEAVEPSSPLAASEVGVRRVPVPARGDRRRGALVSAVQPVLPRC